MAVIIGFAVWGGVSIDKGREGRFPLFTLLLTAAGLIVAMIRLVKGIKDGKWRNCLNNGPVNPASTKYR